jgi:hypothetical protein
LLTLPLVMSTMMLLVLAVLLVLLVLLAMAVSLVGKPSPLPSAATPQLPMPIQKDQTPAWAGGRFSLAEIRRWR